MISRRLHLPLQIQCSLLLLGSVMVAAAQSSTANTSALQGATTLHVTTRLVVLDVVVLDKAGHPISNLDRSQFSITEDKIPQKLRSFDPPSGHAMPGGNHARPVVRGTADLAKIGNAPVNILVFDELNTKWDETGYARLRMEQFLRLSRRSWLLRHYWWLLATRASLCCTTIPRVAQSCWKAFARTSRSIRGK